MDEQHDKLREAFDEASAALLASKDDTVSVSRTSMCAMLDYIGFREFTFAATARRAEGLEPPQFEDIGA